MGFGAPEHLTVTIVPGQLTTITVPYVGPIGYVALNIDPPSLRTNGVQWQLDDRNWQSSMLIASNVLVGTHTINFSPVPGWITPAPMSVTVNAGDWIFTNASYFHAVYRVASPRIGFRMDQSGQSLTSPAHCGLYYQLQYVTNLLQTNWINLGSPLQSTNAGTTIGIGPGVGEQRFYRIIISQ